jgi:hypothetical protein
MKKIMLLLVCISSNYLLKAQNVGIGITTPTARLHVADSSVVFSGNGFVSLPANNPPISGTGRRMMWYADKAAFRTGYVSLANWDNDSVGPYSFAAGFDTKARGSVAIAFGHSTSASANYSTAMGSGSIASGEYSTAMGFYTTARASYSTALGAVTLAKALGSFTVGTYNDTLDGPDPYNVSLDDRLFQVGNGFGTRSNAMTVTRRGYTGISTTQPRATLHVATALSGYVSGSYFPGAIIEGNPNVYLNFLVPGIGESGILFGCNQDAASGGIIYNNAGNIRGMQFRTLNNYTRMVIDQLGNVGIGLNSPSEKLEVTGNVKATSYKYSSPKTFYCSVHPSAFQAEFPSDNIYRDFSSVYYFNPPNGTYMVAPINLPNGAIITGFTVYFVDNSTTEDLRVVLLYHPHLSNGTTELARVVSSGTPGASSSSAPSIGAPAVVNNQLANYAIEANPHSDNPWPGFNLQIRSILITYTMNETQ